MGWGGIPKRCQIKEVSVNVICRCLNVLAWSVVVIASLAYTGVAAQTSDSGPADVIPVSTRPVPAGYPVYKPPARGSPTTRVGGSTRSSGNHGITIDVLAPRQSGYTISPQPTLYWYLSENATREVVVTLVRRGQVDPVHVLRMPPPVEAGIHAYALSEHGVELQAGGIYYWEVRIASDERRTTTSDYAGAWFEYAPPSDALRKRLLENGDRDLVSILAEEGIWYELVSKLSERIANAPADKDLRMQRAHLFEAEGLTEVAAFDRTGGSHKK